MPNTTTNFALPYPAPSDEPCDFPQQWCDFTNAIDAVLDGFQTTIDRTVPVIPVALLQQSVPTTVINGGAIPFDTLLVDTAGMTDMDNTPYQITIRRTGRYTVAGGLLCPTESPPFPPAFVGIGIDEPGVNFATFDFGYVGPNNILHLTASMPVATLTAGEEVILFLFRGSVGSFPIESAWLGVFWHSDTEVP